MAAEARIVDTVSVEDSRASAPRVASKTEQKDAPKADAVAKVSANLVVLTSADLVVPTSVDTVGRALVKPAQRSVPRWVYSEVPLLR
ncbi:hypothetical protein QNA23_07695 [Rhodococcus erythropolis]|uniref:hypothetical protein n=1 Tax=Rhodococcus TaxID=1827 RepID=UPI00080627A4|nr:MULTISPECIES: hypothetical protein [Rhodococcus]ANQ71340.1 hypothetical protein AOT96_11060 [Rhodococcus sp. 008]MCD2155001.1 hypothetical protein [Rhodococcus cerastii]MDI9909312.1 hypothetical protein [Rhodococcus sp. IEGM 1406]MDJ0403355.1 hypothetical protein [Rhodococcus erythropolis]